MWWWIVTALAAAPDKVPAELELASGSVGHLRVSSDERLVSAVANSTVHLLDTEDWNVVTAAPCTVTSAALEYWDTITEYVWIGCSDGTVTLAEWKDGALDLLVDDDGEGLLMDLDSGSVLDLWWEEGGGLIYVLTEGTTVPMLHTINADTGAIDANGFPLAMPRTGYVDSATSPTTLMMFQGGSYVSQLTFGAQAIQPNLQNYPYTVVDSAVTIRSSAYVATAAGIAEYLPTSFVYNLVLVDLVDPGAVGASRVTGDEWLLVYDDLQVGVYELEGGVISSPTPSSRLDVTAPVEDFEVARFGYAFGGTNNGRLDVITANPWLSDVATDLSLVSEGEVVTMSFTSDAAGTYDVVVGGTAYGDGEIVQSGDVAAGETIEAQITVDDSFVEGVNRVFAFVTAASDRIGHAAARLTLNNPPDQVDVTGVTTSESSLTLRWNGITAEDLDHYVAYISTTPFSADDYPTGGPEFAGDDAISPPFEIDGNPGEAMSYRISPLTTDVTYYMAVRAIDETGLEGPMSDVVQGIPQPTYSASELAGDMGGYGCATGAPGTGGFFGLGLGVLALFGRRRGAVTAAAALLFATLAPTPALAQDFTPSFGNVQFSYGGFTYKDPSEITDVYGTTGHGYFRIEAGPQFWRILELDFGMGWYQEKAEAVAWDAETGTGDVTRLRIMPFTLDGVVNLHIWDEQLLVPWFRMGFDYAIWREWRNVDGVKSEATSGGKAGWHYAFGGALLLDVFAKGRASVLEANTGINDTYITFEWRRTRIEPGKFLWFDNSAPLSFSGDEIAVGIKLEY